MKKEEKIEERVAAESQIEESKETSVSDKIIEFVRDQDRGEGVETEEVVKKFQDEDAIKTLLSEGELFEVKPGRIKVLE